MPRPLFFYNSLITKRSKPCLTVALLGCHATTLLNIAAALEPVTQTSSHSFVFFFALSSGADPVAVYRWSIVRSFFKAVHAFKMAGRQHRSSKRKTIG